MGTGWAVEDGSDEATPTLAALPLRPHAVPTALLVVGATAGVVLSEHGNELAVFHVAKPPAAPAVVADFNGDGLNDVIIVARGGVFGYAQVQHLGGLSFSALLLALILGVAAVWYGQHGGSGGGNSSAALGSSSGLGVGMGGDAAASLLGGAGARARKMRSTEYVD